MVLVMAMRVASYNFKNPHDKRMCFLTAVADAPSVSHCLFLTSSLAEEGEFFLSNPEVVRLHVQLMVEDEDTSTLLHGPSEIMIKGEGRFPKGKLDRSRSTVDEVS